MDYLIFWNVKYLKSHSENLHKFNVKNRIYVYKVSNILVYGNVHKTRKTPTKFFFSICIGTRLKGKTHYKIVIIDMIHTMLE